MGKKKTSIYIDEDLWKEWMIHVIQEYDSSRRASEGLEDAMRFYMRPIWVQNLHKDKVENYIRNMKELAPDRFYKEGPSRGGKENYVGMYFTILREKA